MGWGVQGRENESLPAEETCVLCVSIAVHVNLLKALRISAIEKPTELHLPISPQTYLITELFFMGQLFRTGHSMEHIKCAGIQPSPPSCAMSVV